MLSAAVSFTAARFMSMAAAGMSRPVVTAHRIGIIRQRACQKGFHLGIGIACRTGEQADPCLSQCVSRAAADVSADQNLNASHL